jgi:hypothetical protein
MAEPALVHDLVILSKISDLVGHKTFVEDSARTIDLPLAVTLPRSGLRHNALIRLCK